MDDQLACATFATVIPVLMLGGLVTRAYWEDLVLSKLGYLLVTGMLTVVVAGEWASLIGAAYGGDRLEVMAGMVGAGFALGSVFGATFGTISTHRQRHRGRDAKRGKTGDDDADQ